MKGRKISISKEIDTFLGQEKLKMAASTIFSIQKMEKIDNDLFRYLTSEYPGISELIEINVDFLEYFYALH